MNTSRFGIAALIGAISFAATMATGEEPKPTTGDPEIAALKAEIATLKGLLPDQSHAMADVDYHFSNLWFAAKQGNWDLAKFYIDETRSHLNWAVRIRPVRKIASGELDLKPLFQGIEQSALNPLKEAVDKKDAAKFPAAYETMMGACYSCHVASEKPYLRLHIPETPATRMVNLAPNP